MPVVIRLTYDDYCLLPNNGRRYELVDGELFVTPSPRRAHQRVVTELSRILGNFVESASCGELYVVLNRYAVGATQLPALRRRKSAGLQPNLAPIPS